MQPQRFDLRRASVIPFALAILTGTILCLFIAIPATYVAVFVIVSGLVALGGLLLRKMHSFGPVALLLFFVMLSWFRAESNLGREVRWNVHDLAAASDSVSVTGRVFLPANDSYQNHNVVIDQVGIEAQTGSIQLGDLRLRLFADTCLLSTLRYGDIIYAVGRLKSSSERTARFSGALTSVLSKREAADVFVKPDMLFVHYKSGHVMRRMTDQLRQWILVTFDRSLSQDASSLCRALVLGDRQDFGYRFQEQLRLTGLSHIFALSGLNTGLIISLLWVALGVFFLPKNARCLILLVAALLYMELGREVPSLVRATLMCSVFLAGRLLQRKTTVINYLAIALGIELLWRPMDLLDPGFALSYLSVLGMIAGFAVLRKPFSQLLDNRRSGIVKSSAEVLTGTLTAQAGTLPLVGFLFHRLPLLGGLGNLLVVPGFALLLVLALLLLIFAAFAPWLVQFISPSIEGLGFGLGLIVDFFAELPLSGMQIPELSFLMMSVIYLLIFAVPLFWLLERKRTALTSTLLLACLLVWAGTTNGKSDSRMTFIDVGNGDACLVETEGRTILIDAGPRYAEWSAASVVLAYLAERGIMHIDGLILTHPDTDHIGGAAELLQRIDVGKVWCNGDSSASWAFTEFQVATCNKWIEIGALRAGDMIEIASNASFTVLTPDSLCMVRFTESNQKSLAIVLDLDSNTALHAGDIDSTVEHELLAWGQLLDVDILHAGHHGSKRSSCKDFLKAASPDVCVLTAGRRNIYGHPAPEVLKRLADLGIPYLITGRESTIVYESTNQGWKRRKPQAQTLAELWRLPYG